MKRTKDYTITLLIICFLLALMGSMISCNKPVKVCPDCLETNCIYQSINDRVKGKGTDTDIYNAVMDEVKDRRITDSLTIDNILANYYL